MTSYDIAYHRSNMTWCVNMILRMWRHMILRIWRHMISRICRSMTYDVIWYTSWRVTCVMSRMTQYDMWRNMMYINSCMTQYDIWLSCLFRVFFGIWDTILRHIRKIYDWNTILRHIPKNTQKMTQYHITWYSVY